MDWLIKVAVVWISVNIVLIDTLWFASVTIKQLWPDWWRQFVIDLDPEPGVKIF